MTSSEPPLNADDWTDDQWIEWLNQQDGCEDIQEEPIPGPMNRLVHTSGGQAVGSAMMALWQIYYGKANADEIVQVAETPDEPQDTIGRLVLGDEEGDNPKFLLNPQALVKEFVISKLTNDNLLAAADIYFKAKLANYAVLGNDGASAEITKEDALAKWHEIIDTQNFPHKGPLGLFHKNDLIGIINIMSSNDDLNSKRGGEITDLYVTPEFQKRGGGGILLIYALGILKSAGCTSVVVQVTSINLNAVKFFEKYGFLPDTNNATLMPNNNGDKDLYYRYEFA